jgi:hypothetical protein
MLVIGVEAMSSICFYAGSSKVSVPVTFESEGDKRHENRSYKSGIARFFVSSHTI